MPGGGEFDQRRAGNRAGDGATGPGRADPIVSSHDDERRGDDAAKFGTHIVTRRERADEVPHDIGVDAGEVQDPARHIHMGRACIERANLFKKDFEALRRYLSSEGSAGYIEDFGPGTRRQSRRRLGAVFVDRGECGRGVAEDKPTDELRMADRHMHRDESAGRMTEDDGAFDPQQVTKRRDIVGHLLEGAREDRRASGAALTSKIHVDHLRVIAKRSEARLQIAVIEARAAVKRDERRLRLQPPVRDAELRSIDVEVDFSPVQLGTHGNSPPGEASAVIHL